MTAAATNAGARNVRLGLLHARVKRLGLREEDYRARLQREFGVTSARDLNNDQLNRAVDLFHVKQNTALQPHAKLAKALWIALANLGAVEPSDTALDGFVERQTGKPKLAFLTAAESNAVTEALKAMCAREGFAVEGDAKKDRERLLYAIWAKMGRTAISTRPDDRRLSNGHPWALDAWVSKKYGICNGAVCHLTAAQLDECAREFGARLRRTLSLQAAAKQKAAAL